MLGLEKRAVKMVMHEQLALIILAAKWKIYVNNQLGQGTCLYQILCSIRYMIEIQKLIAARKNRVVNHNKVWGKIENYLTLKKNQINYIVSSSHNPNNHQISHFPILYSRQLSDLMNFDQQ
jgi:hypothetical protein